MNKDQKKKMTVEKRRWWKLQKAEAQQELTKQDKSMFSNGFESGFEAAVDYLSTTPVFLWRDYVEYNCHCEDEY